MINKDACVCIIGAGCSGLTAIKNMVQAGIKNVVCYEQNPWVGGNWKYTAEVGHSSVCSTTHIISSKTLSEYTDYPMPDHYPDYPSHQQVLEYFESYADHFGLRAYIRFNSKIENINKNTDNQWIVKIENGDSAVYDYLLIASGHHSVPRHPQFNGEFKGEYLHSHSFKNNEGFEDKKVLVIGAGNSGCDCAVEISRVAEKVDISLRTPQYIIPKFFLGRASDTFNENLLWVPNFIRRLLLKLSVRLQVGKYSDYGLPNPTHDILEAHPTINSELLYKIRHGKVYPKSGIEKIENKTVHFKDGTSHEYDVVLAATGYKISTPFFDKDFLDYSDSNRVPLYLRVFHPAHRNLFFIGLIQPQGAVWPASDLQAKLVANHIIGNWDLPENLEELAEKDSDQIDQLFLKRKRHTIEVNYHRHIRDLKKQIPKNAPECTTSNVSI